MSDVPLFERLGLALVIACLASFLLAFLFYATLPASHWFVVRRLEVGPCVVGSPCRIEYDRDIKREFDGAWTATVRRFEERDGGEAGWVAQCTTPRAFPHYMPDALLPDPVTLFWLTGSERCSKLPPGMYRLEVDWLINVGSPFERDVLAVDVFEVRNAQISDE